MTKNKKIDGSITIETSDMDGDLGAFDVSHLQEALKQLATPILDLSSILEPIISIQTNLSGMAKSLLPEITMPLAVIEEAQKVLVESCDFSFLFHQLAELSQTLNSQAFLELREYDNREKAVFLESGWWLPPSLLNVPVSWLSQAVYAYEGGQHSSITNLFRKVYQADNCQKLEAIVAGWEQNRYFRPWKAHLNNALLAHKEKLYNLSVPILLLVAEGIATDFCKRNGIYESSDRSRGNVKIKKAISQQSKMSQEALPAIFLLEAAIDTMIYEDTDKIKAMLHKNVLNRHAVIHGLKKNYGTLKASLQCFMLLDVLAELE